MLKKYLLISYSEGIFIFGSHDSLVSISVTVKLQ